MSIVTSTPKNPIFHGLPANLFNSHGEIAGVLPVAFVTEKGRYYCLNCLRGAPEKKLSGVEILRRERKYVDNPQKVKEKLKKELMHAANDMQQEEEDACFQPDHIQESEIKTEMFSEENFNVGVAFSQGRRPAMEDEHDADYLKLSLHNKDFKFPYAAVYDGHVGTEAAQYARKLLPIILKDTLELIHKHKKNDNNEVNFTETEIWNALKQACVTLNRNFAYEFQPFCEAGTTVVFSILIDGKLWTASVGDSRAILVRGNETIALTADAKPEVERFKKSVEKRGGFVAPPKSPGECFRVEGYLAMARAIGDAPVDGLSARPKITCVPWQPSDTLILACDGPFEVASRKQVADCVRKNEKNTPTEAAMSVIEHAALSHDNMTVMVVREKAS